MSVAFRASAYRRLRTTAWLVLVTSAFALNGCDRLAASRHFFAGIEHYDRGEFRRAVALFAAAAEARDIPVIRYNLALAHLAFVRSADQPSPEAMMGARAAADDALAAHQEASARRAALLYIKGAVEKVAGNTDAAQRAFRSALASKPGYAPALKALVELSPERTSDLAQLVLSATDVAEPVLDEALPP